MKKYFVLGAIVITLVAALALAGFAYAQEATPPAPDASNGLFGGRGRMGGQGMSRGTSAQAPMGAFEGDGPLHDYMLPALADALNLNPDELQSRREAGETLTQIATAQGIAVEDLPALVSEARQTAVEAALDAGAITQEQADFMLERLNARSESGWTQGFGFGSGGQGRGRMGGQGRGAGAGMGLGTCPYADSGSL